MGRDQRAGSKTAPLSPAEALAHLTKAEEFLRSAQDAMKRGDASAAGANAVLSGINAADCVSGLLQGNRWQGPHEQAAAHVSKAGADGKAVEAQLAKLLRKKTLSQYDSRALRGKEAAELVQAAERALTAARRVAARQKS